jgi:tetratricopeptide (TPR) repeat protein
MASRVNTRFVAFLAVGLMLLGGGVMVAAYFALAKSGADYAAMGDKFANDGNWEKAYEFYGKAVFKKRTNADWVDKWISAMEKTTPTPRQAYIDRYTRDYVLALKAYADALPTDAKAQRRFLDEMFARIRLTGDASEEAWKPLIDAANDAMKRFPEGDASAQELRRYRGLGSIARLPFAAQEQREALVRTASEDLDAAATANPKDEIVAVERGTLRMYRAESMRSAGDTKGADALEQEAQQALQKFLAENPGSSSAMWALLRIELLQGSRASTKPTRAQLYMDKHAGFERVFDAVKAQPAGTVDLLVLAAMCDESRRSELIGFAGVLDLLYSLQAKNPGVTSLSMLIGRYESMSRHYDKAVAAFQKVIEAPDAPLSYEGLALFGRRAEAYKQQIIAKLDARAEIREAVESGNPQALAGVDPAAAEKFLAEAKEIRNKLGAYVGESDSLLLYLDARLLYAAGDIRDAAQKIDDYNRKRINPDPQGLLLQAEVTEKLGEIGAARTAYRAILDRNPENVDVLWRLSVLEEGQRNFPVAIELLREAKRLMPNVDFVNVRLSRLEQVQEGLSQGSTTVKDRVVRAALDAENALTGLAPDYKRAAQVLRAEIDFQTHQAPGTDPQTSQDVITLYPMLVQVLVMDDNRVEALAVTNAGLARAPTNERLKALQKVLQIEDPLEAMLVSIEQNDTLTPFKKRLARYVAFTQAKKEPEAAAELAEAEKLEPRSPAVTEAKFRAAMVRADGLMRAGKPEEAKPFLEIGKALAAEVAQQQPDSADALFYRAQIEITEGHLDEAGATLEAALEKDRTNAGAWSQLGSLRLKMGKNEAAAKAFQNALAIRPQDTVAIKGYMQAASAMGQNDEALRKARESEKYAVTDMEFVDLWLRLEAAVSGDPRTVIEKRRTLARRFAERPPTDPRIAIMNNAELIDLLIQANQFDEARQLIDQYRQAKDDPAYVQADIRWHVARDDIRGAVDIFNKYVTSLPADQHNERPYIVFAQILQEHQRYAVAKQSLVDGAKHEAADSILCEAQLGDLHFGLREWAPAIDAYEAALTKDRKITVPPEQAAAQAAQRVAINAKIVEALVRLERFADADARIKALGPAADSNPVLLLLRADILNGTGKVTEAERAYDAAIAAAKNDPLGYIKRAEFLARDEKHLRDAQQDLEQALKLNPRHLGARQALANIHLRSNETDQAIAVLRDGIVADPDNDQLRLDLIGLHLRLNQGPQAIAVVEEALSRRPEDPSWLFRGREVMYALKRYNDAVGYALRLWNRRKDVEAALTYSDAAMRVDRPDFKQVMDIFATPELKADTNLRLLMARARVQLRRDRTNEALADLRKAMGMINPDLPEQAGLFMSGMTSVYPNPKDRFQAMTSLRPAEGYKTYMALYYAILKSSFPESQAEGIADLRALATSKADPTLRKQAYGVIGGRLRQTGDKEGAVKVWQEGLQLDTDDADLNNNIAYSMTEDFGKAAEALPFAERSVRTNPNNASALDTLGVVYLRLKQLDKAEDALRRSLVASRGSDESAAIMIHLAEVRFERGAKDEACTLLRRARTFLAENPDEQYEAKAKELEAKIGCQ